ncbi:hypothetical protein M407DRAFT_34938 [Tulasnella calospora MUT 4182]|uniref:Uncharacterized protein n=1 Tax=Tulasnella calospora MUT 4182 TaxID=1051891 RepID=A0A0C3PZU4_9AGAM|nr:hypothetical protein M407DRAFT_34938 [Tulasnella calospora MUT 4182]
MNLRLSKTTMKIKSPDIPLLLKPLASPRRWKFPNSSIIPSHELLPYDMGRSAFDAPRHGLQYGNSFNNTATGDCTPSTPTPGVYSHKANAHEYGLRKEKVHQATTLLPRFA